MLATKQEILDRYSKKEMVADKLGRLIGVVNLKFSQRLAVRRMAETNDALSLAYMASAASVREITSDGGQPAIYNFPRSIEELNAVIDMLDDEGMAAVMEAVAKLNGFSEEGEDAAKKSQATPDSSNSAS